MDDHWQDFVIRHLALRADVHLAGHGKPVHASIQAADTVGQCLWQHRHNPVHQVDAGTPCLRLHIKGLMLTDIPADIGNIDTQEKAAVILLFHINAIVQILGILAINGDDFQVPPVLPAVPANMLLSIDGLLHPIRSGLHLSREALRKVILAHDGQDIHSRLSLLADDLDNPALRLLLAIRPPGDLRHHLGAGNGIHGLTLRNVNIRLQAGIIGSHKAKTAAGGINAHNPAVGTLQHLRHPALPGLAAGRGIGWLLCQLHLHRIAVHGGMKLILRDKDIRLIFLHSLRSHKAKAAAVDGNPALHRFISVFQGSIAHIPGWLRLPHLLPGTFAPASLAKAFPAHAHRFSLLFHNLSLPSMHGFS